MTLPSSGSLSLSQIANMFGYTLSPSPGTRIGDYQKVKGGNKPFSHSLGDLQFNTIDGGNSVPRTGQIKFSDFYGTQLQQVVNFWESGRGGFRLIARDRYETDNGTNGNVTVVGGYRDRPSDSSGTKVHIHVKQDIGSEANDPDHCALRTGDQWESGTNLQIDVGSGGRIIGAGGQGGDGPDQAGAGSQGGFGSSALGVQYSNTQLNVSSGALISCGYGGGGGGGGAFDYDHKSSRHAGGGRGGGGAGLPMGQPADEGTNNGQSATAAQSMTEGGEGGGGGTNHHESTGGNGGAGGDIENATQNGGYGSGNENGQQNAFGPAGQDGFTFKKTSGITFGNSEISAASGTVFHGNRGNGVIGDGVQ